MSAIKSVLALGVLGVGGYVLYKMFAGPKEPTPPYGEEWYPHMGEPGYDTYYDQEDMPAPTNPGVTVPMSAMRDPDSGQLTGQPIDLWTMFPGGTPVKFDYWDMQNDPEAASTKQYVLAPGSKPVSAHQLSAFPNDSVVGNWCSCAEIAPNPFSAGDPVGAWAKPSGYFTAPAGVDPDTGDVLYTVTEADAYGNVHPVGKMTTKQVNEYTSQRFPTTPSGITVGAPARISGETIQLGMIGRGGSAANFNTGAQQPAAYPPASASTAYPPGYGQTNTGYLTAVESPEPYAISTQARTPLSQLQLAAQPADGQNWFLGAYNQAQATGVIGATVPISAVSQAQAYPPASAAVLTPATAARASPATMAVAASGEAGRAGYGAATIAKAYSTPKASARTSSYGGWTGWAY